jgi:hypothetical protein
MPSTSATERVASPIPSTGICDELVVVRRAAVDARPSDQDPSKGTSATPLSSRASERVNGSASQATASNTNIDNPTQIIPLRPRSNYQI